MTATAPDSFALGLHDLLPERESAQRKPAFEPGNVVYLKSGGPAMTVNTIRGASQIGRVFVSVEWFAGTELKRDCFDPECLTKDKPAV